MLSPESSIGAAAVFAALFVDGDVAGEGVEGEGLDWSPEGELSLLPKSLLKSPITLVVVGQGGAYVFECSPTSYNNGAVCHLIILSWQAITVKTTDRVCT